MITTLKKLKEATARDVPRDFYIYGRSNSYATSLGCLKFASAYDLVTPELKPVNAAAKRILTICQKEFLREQSNAKKRSVWA